MRQNIFIALIFSLLNLTFAPTMIEAASYGWGYKPENDGKLPDVGKYAEIIQPYHAYYADLSGDKDIYLTFDNGYEQGYTADILDVLKENKVPATFFVTGHYVKDQPELIKRFVKEGHIIGNHSHSHFDFTTLSEAEIKQELEKVEKAVALLTPQKSMQYLRTPRGTFSDKTLAYTTELGYIQVFWSLAFMDWDINKQKGADYAYEAIMRQVHPGAIILLHAVSEDNALALDKVIKNLKEDGYTFRSLDELMLKNLLP